jgi:hypothetical protein
LYSLEFSARAQRHSRFLRARTPALRSYKTSSFTSRRPYKIDDRTPRKPIPYTRTRQNSYPSRSSISTGRLRLSSKEERPVTRRNSSDKRSYLADSNDIQKILSLDDPEEKIARLLSMLDKNLSKESEKRALDVKVVVFECTLILAESILFDGIFVFVHVSTVYYIWNTLLVIR